MYETGKGLDWSYLYPMVSFFQNIVGFLNEEEIPYMLTGSMAMGIYTVARSTQDFDFVVHLNNGDVRKVVARFDKGYYCDEDAINDAIKRKSMFNVIEHATSFKADFILLKDNEYQQTAFGRRTKVPLLGTEAHVISGEDLILSKLIWIQRLQSGRQMETFNPFLNIRTWIGSISATG